MDLRRIAQYSGIGLMAAGSALAIPRITSSMLDMPDRKIVAEISGKVRISTDAKYNFELLYMGRTYLFNTNINDAFPSRKFPIDAVITTEIASNNNNPYYLGFIQPNKIECIEDGSRR